MYRFLLISRRMSAVIAVALLLGVTSVPQAQAGYTAVRQPKRVTEPSHEQILERMYGGNFVADASGLNFSNESGVTVTRLDDTATASATASTDESWPTRNTSAGRGRKASRMFSSIAGPNRDDTDHLVSHQVDTPGEATGPPRIFCAGRTSSARAATGITTTRSARSNRRMPRTRVRPRRHWPSRS